MTYEMALALLIVILIIGSSFTIFRSTWGPVVRAVYEGIVDIVLSIRNIDWKELEEQAEEKRRNKVKEPLTWEKIKYNYTIPAVFLIVFPIYYLFMRKLDVQLGDDMNTGSVVISTVVIIGLIMLVVWALGQYEKNLRRKFWMELVVALFIEIGVVFDFHLLIEGYYFESVRGAKSLASTVLIIPFYIMYFEKCVHNWKALQDSKKLDK